MKKIICLFLLLPAVVQAQFNYITNSGNIIITGYTGSDSVVVIPDRTNGLPVTGIGASAFYMRGFITSLTIGTNVTSIGSGAFENCSGLTNITIPNSVISIGDDAFHWCDNLAFVTIGTNVTSIGELAFYGCGSLTSVTIPSSVTSIGWMAFACYDYLASSLTAINVDASNPAYCSVDGVLFNKSKTTLVQCPFGRAGVYAIPGSVTSIGDNAFDYCIFLTDVTIPDSVTSIGRGAFTYCSLTNITIGTNVTSIGYWGFGDCGRLTSVTIPASVTNIAEFAFAPCASLTAINVDTNNPAYCSVDGVLFNKSKTTLVQFPGGLAGSYTIPNGVTNIGDAAFYVCASLTNITAPASVTRIGEEGFAFCYTLTGLCLPGNAPSLGGDAFYVAPVTIYYLPTTSGWVGTTYGDRRLVPAYPQITAGPLDRTDGVSSTVTFSVTATGAAQMTYQWSKDGTNLVDAGAISGAATSILTINNVQLTNAGSYAVLVTNLYGNMSTGAVLTVTLSSPVADFVYFTNNGSITISGYNGLGGTVIIPDSIGVIPVTSVAAYAFYSISSLTRVTIPTSVTSIAAYAFFYCPGLTNVIIGSGVTNISNPAFASCSALTAITVDEGNAVYASEGGVLFDKTKTTLLQCPSGLAGSYVISNRVTSISSSAFSSCANLTSVTIPGSIQNISDYVFGGCTSLTNVIIPNSVTNFGNGAFSGCSSLASITIPNGVLSIGDSAFNYCTGLTNVSIPGSVITIGSGAFYGCSGLNGVAIPSSVTSIGYGAFGGCSSLVAINVDTNNPAYSSVMGILFNKSQTALILCPVGKSGSFTVSSSCTSIADGAFSGCSSLTQITIPDTVTNIGMGAFSGCSRLTSINIPNNVTSIGMSMFEECMNLTSVTLPNSVTSIGDMAFSQCSSLTNIAIPAGVLYIGGSAFSWCTSLTQITIPNTVTNIGFYAFSGCGLTSITLPNQMTSIGSGMFYNCMNLTSVTLPNSVTSIGNEAFSYCHSLTNITIPASVVSFDFYAFLWCTSLKEVHFLGNAPSGTYVFWGDDAATAYYLSGTTGWGSYIGGMSPDNGGIPTALWIPASSPDIQLSGASFGGLSNQFGFNITGSGNQQVVVEACTDLANPVWLPIYTNTLTGGSIPFSDPDWTNYPGRFYRVQVMDNNLPANMALIPAGNFTMGDNLDGYSPGLPLHTVSVSAFYMDKYDVTEALWQQVFNWARNHGYSFDYPGSVPGSAYSSYSKGPNYPVVILDWYDCVKWCNARSEMEGRTPAYYTSAAQTTVYRTGEVDVDNDSVKWNAGYRLPTEAEWEKAARGGASGQRFPWGNTISWSQANYYAYPLSADPDYGYAYDVNPTEGYHPTFSTGDYPYTNPVGYFAANGYGLYDMAGNVWQWCWDWYGDYSSGSQTDPRGPTTVSARVQRGGSWTDTAGYGLRSADRGAYTPVSANYNIGFRSVLSPGQ